ncbi:MAG: 7-carboxy-7-deazaguanine synthase QueE [Bacteroidia bacterium]
MSELIQNNSLPVMEHFYTLQGEGAYTGHAAYFVRLGGCDVGCVWCDVKESWDINAHPQITIQNIVSFISDAKSPIAVITGGEPLMHNLDALTESIQLKGIRTHIETSASHPLSGNWDWICVSPKKFKAPLPEILFKANELKVIIFNKSDFEWAEKHASMVGQDCQLFLQPEWDQQSKMLPLIIDYVKQNPKWKIGLQTHKWMQIP